MRAPRWAHRRVPAPAWAFALALVSWIVEDAARGILRALVGALLALALCAVGG